MSGRRFSEQAAVIFCFSSDHPKKRTEILAFNRDEHGRWSAGYKGTKHGKDWTGDQILTGNEIAPSGLPADALATAERMGMRRRRNVLRCPLCGRSVTVRGERLDPILDELAEAWAKHPDTDPDTPMVVPLSELAARV